MAISFVSATNQIVDSSPQSATVTGSNPFGFVSVTRRGGSTISVTWNGVSMTQIGSQGGHVNAGDTQYLFGIKNPGTGNVAVTHNGTNIFWQIVLYNGVDQTTGFESANTAGGSTTTAAVTVTPTKSDWIVGGGWVNGTATADGNTTLRNAGSVNNNIFYDSNANKTSAYTVGASLTLSGWDLVACGLIDVSQPTTANSGFFRAAMN